MDTVCTKDWKEVNSHVFTAYFSDSLNRRVCVCVCVCVCACGQILITAGYQMCLSTLVSSDLYVVKAGLYGIRLPWHTHTHKHKHRYTQVYQKKFSVNSSCQFLMSVTSDQCGCVQHTIHKFSASLLQSSVSHDLSVRWTSSAQHNEISTTQWNLRNTMHRTNFVVLC